MSSPVHFTSFNQIKERLTALEHDQQIAVYDKISELLRRVEALEVDSHERVDKLEHQITKVETNTNKLRVHVYNLDVAAENMVLACDTQNDTQEISTDFEYTDATSMSN